MDGMSVGADAQAEVLEGVARLCAGYPGEYWRKLDEVRGYPTEFVRALTESGYLGALIPEEYGGAGLPLSAAAAILEEVQRQGCNGGACHAQMYIMGTILRHGSPAQKAEYLPQIADGSLRLQAFGVTEPTSGTDTTALRTTARREGDEYVVNGQKLWTSRAEHSDLMLLLARTTPRDQVAKKTDGLSTFIVDMRTVRDCGLTIRPIRTMMNHNSCEVFRRHADTGRQPGRRGGQGFPIHPVGHERRAHPDRGGVRGRRQVVHRACQRLCAGPGGVRAADRAEPGGAVPDRPRLRQHAGGGADGAGGAAAVRGRGQPRGGGQHGEDAGRGCVIRGGECVHPDLRRIWICRGVRRGTQVPGDPAVSGCADLDQPDPVLPGGACAGDAAVLLTPRQASF